MEIPRKYKGGPARIDGPGGVRLEAHLGIKPNSEVVVTRLVIDCPTGIDPDLVRRRLSLARFEALVGRLRAAHVWDRFVGDPDAGDPNQLSDFDRDEIQKWADRHLFGDGKPAIEGLDLTLPKGREEDGSRAESFYWRVGDLWGRLAGEGVPPAGLIAEANKVSRRTVEGWIAKARDKRRILSATRGGRVA